MIKVIEPNGKEFYFVSKDLKIKCNEKCIIITKGISSKIVAVLPLNYVVILTED